MTKGATPAHLAAAAGKSEVIALLHELGCGDSFSVVPMGLRLLFQASSKFGTRPMVPVQ